MTGFHFRLDKVLEWRRTELELAELRFRQQAGAMGDLDRQRAEIEASGIRTELEVREWQGVNGRDLAALGAFRLFVREREAEIDRKRADCRKVLEQRQSEMMEARRRCRLLERLKERRRLEWEKSRDRELEQLASESYLARWAREANQL
jgi:flagellar export protein FliJ